MVHAQTSIWSGEEDAQIFRNFEIQADPLTPVRRPDLVIINKKKENLP